MSFTFIVFIINLHLGEKTEASFSSSPHIYFHCKLIHIYIYKISIYCDFCDYMGVGSTPVKTVPIKMNTGAVLLRSKGIHPGALDLGTENSLCFCAFHS